MGNPKLTVIKDKEQTFEIAVSDVDLIKSLSKVKKQEQKNLIQTIFELGLKVWKISNVEVDYQKLEDISSELKMELDSLLIKYQDESNKNGEGFIIKYKNVLDDLLLKIKKKN